MGGAVRGKPVALDAVLGGIIFNLTLGVGIVALVSQTALAVPLNVIPSLLR
jgi:Ca2+/Na+ antiporter